VLIVSPIQHLKVEVDGGAADGNDAVEAVVLAANRLRSAGGAADTDDGEGRAGEADVGGDALEDNAEQAQQDRSDGVAGGRRAFAALLVTDVALADCDRSRGFRRGDGDGGRVVPLHQRRRRRGGRKKRERQNSSDSGELHLWVWGGKVLYEER